MIAAILTSLNKQITTGLPLLMSVLFCTGIVNCASAQSGWQNWETIFSDGDITVELQFCHSENACDSDAGKPFKYRGRLTGNYKTTPTFVNFKTAFTDCAGNQVWRYFSFKIWSSGGERVSKMMDESLDYSFIAGSLIQTAYDVSLETSKMTGSGVGPPGGSKKPAGISGKSLINYGESTQLTVSGGKLGIGADWYWYKDNCGASLIGKGSSVTVAPTKLTKYFVRAEGKNNSTECVSLTVDVNMKSIGATSIEGEEALCEGISEVLSVVGGKLGPGARWVWYEGACAGYGKKIGEGEKMKVSPSSNTTYFVRAESKHNITACVSKSVMIVNQSSAPSQIIASPSDDVICQGTSVELSVKGGKLASDAEWVWYSDGCGTNQVGKGPSIKVKPDNSTVYYVRAEGACKNTICISYRLKVMEESQPPSYVNSANDKLIRGQKTVLSVVGGKLGEQASWKWYEGACGINSIGSGPSISVKPKKNTTYYVRAEGWCNITNCASKRVEPLKKHHWTDTYLSGGGIRKFLHLGFGAGLTYFQQKKNVFADYYDFDGSYLFTDFETISFPVSAVTGQFVFHPIMKEGLSIGFNTSASFGMYINDNNYEYKVDYFFKRLDMGSEFVIGTTPLKLLVKLDRSVQPDNFLKAPKLNTVYTVYYLDYTFRSEMISGGFRFGRYSRALDDVNKANLDVVYTVSRYHDNNIASFNGSDYSGFSNWYAGLGFDWWVQSKYRLKLDLQFNITQGEMNWSEPDFSKTSVNLTFLVNKNLFY
jgi:hypothetical protein